MPNKLRIIKIYGDIIYKFRIVEGYDTIDGLRWRFADACFATYNEARKYISKVKKEYQSK